jgi:hypothetical protein
MSPYGLDDGECFFSEEIDTATTFKHESCNCLPAVRPVPLVGYLSGSAVVKPPTRMLKRLVSMVAFRLELVDWGILLPRSPERRNLSDETQPL